MSKVLTVCLTGLFGSMTVIFSLYMIAVGDSNRKQEGIRQATQHVYSVVVKNFSGFPAPESELVPGGFYYCHASIIETLPSRTNFFAVLREMMPGPHETWRVANTNRFFELRRKLEEGTIYLIGKGGTNLIYKQVATPSGLQISNQPQA